MNQLSPYTAFHGPKCIANGGLREIAASLKAYFSDEAPNDLMVFDNANSHLVDIDLRGEVAEVLARLPSEAIPEAPAVEAQRGPGRPKLGVTAKEVTLLPRHWEWLAAQPGGASVALRKLVEAARRDNADKDTLRAAQERAYRFMSATLSDKPGFEEASRALFAGKRERFDECTAAWPADLLEHLGKLAQAAFPGDGRGEPA